MNNVVFENKIKIKIYGPNIELDDADAEFTTEFTDEKEPNSCKLKIFNLNEQNMDAVLTKTTSVEIFTNQYGLTDDNGELLWEYAFNGRLREAIKKPKVSYTKKGKPRKSSAKVKYLTPSITTGDDEADDYIEIELQEGNSRDIGTFCSKSYRSGFSVKKILTDLAQEVGYGIIFDKNVQNFTITYPIILQENARDSLSKVASYIGADCNIANGKVYITSKTPTATTTYYQFDEDNIPQPKYLQEKKIEFVAPYMPALHTGQFVKLINRKMEIDGLYKICKLESKFSNCGDDCETTVTVKY